MNWPMERSDIAWYLVQCKPRQEGRAQEHLDRQGFECFYPTTWVATLKAGKVNKRMQPLFPSYLFIRLGSQDNWTALRSTRGVSRVVSFAGQPCRVHDAIIEHLIQRCTDTAGGSALNPGDKIQVKVGPYAEMEAIFLAMDGDERVMLLLNMLNREQQVRVPLSQVTA